MRIVTSSESDGVVRSSMDAVSVPLLDRLSVFLCWEFFRRWYFPGLNIPTAATTKGILGTCYAALDTSKQSVASFSLLDVWRVYALANCPLEFGVAGEQRSSIPVNSGVHACQKNV